MNHSPRISIIVPVYDTARWLPRCLDSVLGQSFGDVEVICVFRDSGKEEDEAVETRDGRETGSRYYDNKGKGLQQPSPEQRLTVSRTVWNKLFRRNIIEDHAFTVNYLLTCGKILFLDDRLYLYHRNSATRLRKWPLPLAEPWLQAVRDGDCQIFFGKSSSRTNILNLKRRHGLQKLLYVGNSGEDKTCKFSHGKFGVGNVLPA